MSEEIKNSSEEAFENSKEEIKPVTDNDEIKAFHKEVLGKLDNPLVVHKKGDASYEEDTSAFDMEMTHNEETKPTLERHRFKKEPKSKGNTLVSVLLVIIIIACVFAGLYLTGHLPFTQQEDTTAAEATTEEETTSIAEKYAGTIVVKNTDIFVDGYEVDGIQGLQDALKYIDASPTAFLIINEHADADYLNYDIYPILTDLGFFSDKTVVEVREKTGLMSQKEIEEEEAAKAAAEAAATEAPTEPETEPETEEVSE